MSREVLHITPKGMAAVCMVESGLIKSIEDPRLERFWNLFVKSMLEHGYVQEAPNE